MPIRLIFMLALTLIAPGVHAAAEHEQEPPLAPGFVATPVHETGSVSVSRLHVAVGARETPHSHPYPVLMVLLGRGEVEMQNGSAPARATRKPGDIEFIGARTTHAAANVGALPFDALVVAFKPDRVRGGMIVPLRPLPGASRTSLLDNADVNVTRLDFDEDVREAVHTHPYDLLVVAISPARIDMQNGGSKNVHSYAVGESVIIPRGVPHAVANAGTAPFRVLAIAIR